MLPISKRQVQSIIINCYKSHQGVLLKNAHFTRGITFFEEILSCQWMQESSLTVLQMISARLCWEEEDLVLYQIY